MLKFLICVSIILVFMNQKTAARSNAFNQFLGKIRELEENKLKELENCQTNSDCPEFYFCNNNDCVAQKKEYSFCLSGKNEECNCGKCIIDEETWAQSCHNEDTYQCPNEGYTKDNACLRNSDCPDGYFCDEMNENVCTSKFAKGRMCSNNDMCICDSCVTKKVYTRKSKNPIEYNICEC